MTENFIYSISIKVTHAINSNWVLWMQQEHIPAIMATGCFTKYVFTKLLEVDEEDGLTYSCQYYAVAKADYNRYIEIHSQQLRQEGMQKWGNQFIAFRSLMQVVN
jgi:hypothetical protein